MKAVLVGAGGSGRRLYEKLKDKYEIIGFWDNDLAKSYQKIGGVEVCLPNIADIRKTDVFIVSSVPGLGSITEQLVELGVREENIISRYVEQPLIARKQFLMNFSELIYDRGIQGSCAEVGVFQGDYAKVINETFYDRTLYLFDTFEGFAKEDIEVEKNNNFSEVNVGGYNMTSEELVINKMVYKENCIIRKGFFPQTAEDLKEKFCYVNLDLDLYQPTIKGLHFFYDNELIAEGGLVTVHDYFSTEFKGIKAAVDEFISESKGFRVLPIGDSLSIAVIRA